ncbi:uncharacterized protein ARMOST_15968 [Armillaria ostoyae]|uniref:Uncharacterized protein n=1 Tax=Armillaria ostoyae TaxID=47428 RepID=A0A284RUX6_ARMOS|nr:uncharacterized protein ARMOST_15968 [Armillaria ostoyae]
MLVGRDADVYLTGELQPAFGYALPQMPVESNALPGSTNIKLSLRKASSLPQRLLADYYQSVQSHRYGRGSDQTYLIHDRGIGGFVSAFNDTIQRS